MSDDAIVQFGMCIVLAIMICNSNSAFKSILKEITEPFLPASLQKTKNACKP